MSALESTTWKKKKLIYSNPICKYGSFPDLLHCSVRKFIFNLKATWCNCARFSCASPQSLCLFFSVAPVHLSIQDNFQATIRSFSVSIWRYGKGDCCSPINSIPVLSIESEIVSYDDDTFNLIVWETFGCMRTFCSAVVR